MAKLRQCLGIDIGSNSIRIAEVTTASKKLSVKNLIEARLEIDPGMTDVQRQAAISGQINSILKANKIKTKNAVFSLSGQTAFVRLLKVPATTEDRLARIIQFEAKEQIPFPLEQTSFEYQIFPTDSPTELEVLLVAIRKDHIEGFMKLVKRTNLAPHAISVSSLAVHNFYEVNSAPKDLFTRTERRKAESVKKKGKKKKGEPEEAADAGDEAVGMEFEEIQAEVNLGGMMMDLAIPKAGGRKLLGFVRTVPVGGSHMDRAIRQKLNLPSLDEAKRIKENEAAILSSEFELSSDAADVNMAASQAATVVANSIVAEIRRSLEFFISQPDGVAVDSIVLSGGLARMKYLDSYIEEKMGLPVELARPKNEAIEAPEGLADQIPKFVIPLGLAFQGLGISQLGIDFLPQDIKNVRAFTENKIPLAVAAASLLLTIGLSYNAGEKYIAQFNSYADKAEAIKASALQQSELMKAAELANSQVAAKYAEVGRLITPRDYWIKFAAAFHQARPSEVLVEQIDMQADGYVTVVGMVRQRTSVIAFMDDLRKDALFFRSVELKTLGAPPPSPPPPFDGLRFQLLIKTGSMQGKHIPIKTTIKGNVNATSNTGGPRPGGGMRPRPGGGGGAAGNRGTFSGR